MALVDDEDLEITAEQIAYEGLEELDGKYQKSIGFFAWDFFVAAGKILKTLWDKVIYIANCLTDLSNMNYSDLVNFVYQTRGISVKTASASSGYLTVTNGAGTITEGSIFETSSGLQFQSVLTVDVSQGDTFEVECLTTGTEGNVPVGAICVIPSTIEGIVAVSNEDAFTNGYDAETAEELLDRYYEDIQESATCGNVYHYKKWALEVDGVKNAIIKPLWNGDNTVKIVIMDSNTGVADDTLIKTVQDYIDPYEEDEDGNKAGWGCGLGEAPIGAYCTVVSVSALNLSVSASIILSSGADLDETIENIKTNINDYLSEISLDGDSTSILTTYVSYNKIGSLIMSANGVYDYSDLLLNGGTDNILIQDDNTDTQIPILNTLTITEEE